MTDDEARKVAIWAVCMSQEYKVSTQKIVDVFVELYKFNKNIDACKNMIEQGAIEMGVAQNE